MSLEFTEMAMYAYTKLSAFTERERVMRVMIRIEGQIDTTAKLIRNKAPTPFVIWPTIPFRYQYHGLNCIIISSIHFK
jgi:hypothetical protein